MLISFKQLLKINIVRFCIFSGDVSCYFHYKTQDIISHLYMISGQVGYRSQLLARDVTGVFARADFPSMFAHI